MTPAFPKPPLKLASAAPRGDHRRRSRDRTTKPCIIVHGMFREKHNGVVRDIHEGGARIRPSGPADTFHGRVELIVGDQTFHGEIVWRNRTEMGVRFDVSDPLAPQALGRR